MITGANTNIRHRGMLFHVQTEDSGRANPHIISHVYQGGIIVATHKREYSDLAESPDLAGEVKRWIEEQHKAMLKQLRAGEFDDAIDARLDTPAASTAPGLDGVSTKPETDPAPMELDELRVPTERVPTPESVSVSKGRSGFGKSPDFQKPLDEVILEYLVEKARERSDPRPLRKSRHKV